MSILVGGVQGVQAGISSLDPATPLSPFANWRACPLAIGAQPAATSSVKDCFVPDQYTLGNGSSARPLVETAPLLSAELRRICNYVQKMELF